VACIFRSVDHHRQARFLSEGSAPAETEGELKDTVQHRTSKYLNNRIEADHGALKRLIRPTRGFQSMKTAYATIKGFEVMRMIRRRYCILIDGRSPRQSSSRR
jgi:transposase-like protein